jgi:hypothetical protein
MTLTPELRAHLSTLPGRCSSCCFHVEKQHGHAPTCTAGEQLRDDAYRQMDAAKGAAEETALLRRAILTLGRQKLEFTADDLPVDLRNTTNPNRRGRVFASLVESRQIRIVGERKSANPKAHGKKVWVYRVT